MNSGAARNIILSRATNGQPMGGDARRRSLGGVMLILKITGRNGLYFLSSFYNLDIGYITLYA